MFVREVVATSDLYQTVRIKLKLLRPLNPTNETRPILYSYHLTVLASEIVNSVHLSTFFEAFLWRLLIDERKTSIFWEKCFVEKYDWCGAKKGHPEPTIQLLFLLPSPNCFKSFFINRQSRKFAFIDVEVKKVKSIKKNYSHFLPPWRLRRGSKESLSLPPCIQSPDVGLGRYTINYCVSEKFLHTKHCQRHSGPKALGTLTHSPPLDQSRCFNKLWNLCQPSFV